MTISTVRAPFRSRARVLRYAAVLFLAGFALHNADHLRRGLAVLMPVVL